MTSFHPCSPASDPNAKVGVLLYMTTAEIDAILADTVALIRGRGLSVGGLLQRNAERLPSGRHAMWVDDIVTGQTIRLDQSRGPGARACVLDPDALAQAACWVRDTIDTGVDLIVINRFGHAEAEGEGLRSEIAAALLSGAAVLIAVRPGRLDALEHFLGGTALLLDGTPEAIADWAERAAAVGIAAELEG